METKSKSKRKPDLHAPDLKSPSAHEDRSYDAKILRLVRRAPENRAIKAGEVDAIIDPASGRAILLPDAQAALLERKARFRRLVELFSDGYWELDEHYHFVSHAGTAIGNERTDDDGILGKALWDLPFDNDREVDWQTLRTQLEWRAIFRDLELRCVDRDGKLRIISISGEPAFDRQGQFKGYHGITRDISERKQAEIAAPESDRFARATLDALAAQVCVLDAAGTIITANAAWRVLAATDRGIAAGISEGSSYLAACGQIVGEERVDAVAITAGVRQVIAGERELFRYEYFCDAPSEPRWFMATVIRSRGDGVARAIVSYEDITDIKRAEQLLRLEYTVARCLAGADDTSAALQAVIRTVCETQNWDCGRYFRLEPASGVLHLDASWGVPAAAVDRFLEKSRGAVFRPGAGLAGRVCQSGEPLWILNVPKDARASQMALAHETGLDGAFAFPVSADGATIGVLAFASRIVREPDERLLRTVHSIGHQLGQFIQRRQAEDTLRQSELRFRRLTELSADWHWEQDSQFRFTKVVGTGIAGAGDILGKTLWELSTVVLSDDELTKHKSELAARWSFCDFECAAVLPDGQLGYYCISGEPVYDDTGTFTGFHGTGLDITQRKRIEIALRQSEERLRALVGPASD
jgi:PAS domain S-box-containing protein